MSSCESYIIHHFILDLDDEDMRLLRYMLSVAAKYLPNTGDCIAFDKMVKLVGCIE